MNNGHLIIGNVYKPYGKLAMIGILSGERYYWFVDRYGDVAMMPSEFCDKFCVPVKRRKGTAE